MSNPSEDLKIVEKHLKLFSSVSGILKKFCRDWQLDFEEEFSAFDNKLEESEKNTKNLLDRIESGNKKCVVFGRTSTGKSTFINCLLGRKILPYGPGVTTNTFIDIRRSPDTENHFKKGGLEITLDEFQKQAKSNTNEDILRFLYAPGEGYEFPKDLIIYDLPGINFNYAIDDKIRECCKDFDVIILMLNALQVLDEKDQENILSWKTCFAHFNIFIVFNFWDHVVNGDNSEEIIDKCKRESKEIAKNFLVNKLHISDKLADKRIHFISSFEVIRCLENNQLNNAWMKDYDAMKNELMIQLNISIVNKHTTYRNEITKIFKDLYIHMNTIFNTLDQSKKGLIENIKNQMNPQLNQTINTIIKNEIETAFESCFESALDIVKNYQPNNLTNSRLNLINGEGDNENSSLEDELENLYIEKVTAMLEKIKSDILEPIHKEADVRKRDFQVNVMEQLYFPLFMDLSRELETIKPGDIVDMCREINKVKKHGTIGTICVASGLGAIGTGILAPIALPIEGALLLTGAAVGGTVVGGGIISGISTGITTGLNKLMKEPFFQFWKKNKATLRSQWVPFEVALSDSYKTFEDDLSTYINHIYEPLRSGVNNINNEFEPLTLLTEN